MSQLVNNPGLIEVKSDERNVFALVNELRKLVIGWTADTWLSVAVTASVAGPFPFACTFAGAKVGDAVVLAVDLSGVVDAGPKFEATVTVAGQVQQVAGFAGAATKVPVVLRRPGGFHRL